MNSTIIPTGHTKDKLASEALFGRFNKAEECLLSRPPNRGSTARQEPDHGVFNFRSGVWESPTIKKDERVENNATLQTEKLLPGNQTGKGLNGASK